MLNDNGFARGILVPAKPFPRWLSDVTARPDPRYSKLSADIRRERPDAQSLLLLPMPYLPYAETPDEITISAYYPVSNASYQAAKNMGEICDNVPLKSALVRSGLAKYGRNGLTSLPEFGTRFVLQCLLSTEKAEDMPEPENCLAPECHGCSLCVKMCPTGALRGDGSVDISKCLRAQDESKPLPEHMRPLIGNSLLGCEICQNVCPRNRNIQRENMSPELRNALKIEELLRGNVTPLIPYLGKNYVRAKRLAARACIVAANLRRHDLFPLITQLTVSDYPALREHALWAAELLKL